MRYTAAGVVLSLTLAVGCTQQQAQQTAPAPDQAAIRSAIETQLTKVVEAVTAKNAPAVAGLFTDDATWILPDASTFKGRDAIQTGASQFFTSFDSVTSASETVDRVIVVTDSQAVSFATGKYMLWMKGQKQGAAHVNPFADEWRKGADGVWRIAYEVNAEGPAPGAASAAAKK